VTGCTKISIGCRNCYAERMAKRLQAIGVPSYRNGFCVTLHPELLALPLKWKKPRLVFVNSMSDLFHEDIPLDFIMAVFAVMRQAAHHQFQILTKRSRRLLELHKELEWPDNVWMGVTVESAGNINRIAHLTRTRAKNRFLSLEPLLGPIPDLQIRGIDWVIVGGESGPGARPMMKDWVVDIRDQCLAAETPFFFKQWGGFRKKRNGRLLESRVWGQMPQALLSFSSA
jgi:protein gp37